MTKTIVFSNPNVVRLHTLASFDRGGYGINIQPVTARMKMMMAKTTVMRLEATKDDGDASKMVAVVAMVATKNK